MLHESYTEVLSDIKDVQEKFENLFLKEKQSAHHTELTDYFEFE